MPKDLWEPTPCRIIPHKRYIMSMMMSGLSDKDINIITACEGFNHPADSMMVQIRDECETIPGAKEMIAANTEGILKKAKPVIAKEVLDNFKYGEYFEDLVYHGMGYPRKKHACSKFNMISRILSQRRLRAFIEIAAIINMPLKDIRDGWQKIAPGKNNMISNYKLGCYYYYYWGFTMSRMNSVGAKRDVDIASYLRLDNTNMYYMPHRSLMFQSPEVIYGYFGIMTSEDKLRLEKEEWGRCHSLIVDALDKKSYSLPPWVVAEHARIANVIENEEGQEGKEYYREQLERIFSRAVTRTQDHTLSDIYRNKKRLSREPEGDEEYTIKRKH
jgi:hypothetical protein